ncbi:MAG: carboxylesterase/lipase family protein [Arenimonas sp.]
MHKTILGKIIFAVMALAGAQLFCGHAIASAANSPNTAPMVRIDAGMLEGSQNKTVSSFKGIPFAAAPVGQWRWREPQPVTAWKNVRDAKQFGSSCIQAPGLSVLSDAGDPGALSEDCLYLNIWTPDLKPAAKLPVMVWIHGGALVFGSGSVVGYDGAPLARRGVVMVTINYRMGPLGFFSHPAIDAEKNGNAKNFGLLDQIAALKWVQKNIALFGGNPDNVTIFGESAGAQSVLALYASPMARGLFHKGIAQSSYGLPSHTPAKAREVGIAVASAVGLDGANASAAQLRAIPAEQFGKLPGRELTLAPSFIVGDAAMPISILEAFQKKQQAAVPLIIGSNSNEASVATAFGVDPGQIIAGLGKARILVKPLYPKVSDNAELGNQVMRDAVFTAFARRISYLQSQRAPAWRYYFSYVQQGLRDTQTGVPHAGEIAFTMDTGTDCRCLKVPFAKPDQVLSKKMGDSWVAFARNGNPQIPQFPAWPKDSVKNDTLMEFSDNAIVRKKFMQPRLNALILGLKAAD